MVMKKKSWLKEWRKIRCHAYLTVEASYVLPLAIGVVFFCMAMFFFIYDRGVIYQNMLRQGVVTQMEQDEEKAEHEITMFPTMSLQKEQLSMERGNGEIRVGSSATQKNPLKNLGFMPVKKTFTSEAQATLPIYDPVEHLRGIRRVLWVAKKAGESFQ